MSWDELQFATPTIPKAIVPPASPVSEDADDDSFRKARIEELEALNSKLLALNDAISDLRNVDRVYRATGLRTFPTEETELLIADRGLTRAMSLRTLPTPLLRVSPVTPVTPMPPDTTPADTPSTPVEIERLSVTVPARKPWVFTEFGDKSLKSTTKSLLAAKKADLDECEVVEIISALEGEMADAATSYFKSFSNQAVLYVADSDAYRQVAELVPVSFTPVKPTKKVVPPAPGSAASRGIRPLGVGDLLVVKQELLRYAAGEVAHIENILKSEHKTRTHTRLRETEEIIITETEELEESEKDLQSTERFELHKEAQKTIESEMAIEAGLSVTASFGFVTTTAHADFALSQSSSESSKNASTFAKEVMERSVSRITQRAREERTRRALERFEEINEHGFDNRDGDGHVIGVYRWVDKYYKARIVNYGRRLMMEFVIPEPAAFYLHAESNQELQGVTLGRPKEPKIWGRRLEPTDLNKWNYTDYVAEYNVQDVEAYPDEIVKVGAAFAEAPGKQGNVVYANTSEKLKVPPRYEVVCVSGECGIEGLKGTLIHIGEFEMGIGGQYWGEVSIAGEPMGSVAASGLGGVVPISVQGYLRSFHVNVVATCRLRDVAKKTWQLKTYQAIMNAYERALAEYNEQVAAAQIQAGVQIEGRNPEINRKIERDELRKGVLRLLTNEYAKTRVGGDWRDNEMFDAMRPSGQYGYPEFCVDEALVEGKIIQFFEQAFEWNNMTYRFYPYFWGRKDNWMNTFPHLDHPDPQFTDFLRAGAARVVVPVHPSYNEVMLHYLFTNEIWNGGQPPALDDPLYISIVDEIKADTGADINDDLPVCSIDSGYPCIVDEWEVKLPTSLVYLQEDSALPDFTA